MLVCSWTCVRAGEQMQSFEFTQSKSSTNCFPYRLPSPPFSESVRVKTKGCVLYHSSSTHECAAALRYFSQSSFNQGVQAMIVNTLTQSRPAAMSSRRRKSSYWPDSISMLIMPTKQFNMPSKWWILFYKKFSSVIVFKDHNISTFDKESLLEYQPPSVEQFCLCRYGDSPWSSCFTYCQGNLEEVPWTWCRENKSLCRSRQGNASFLTTERDNVFFTSSRRDST